MSAVANVVVALLYLAVATAIMTPLVRTGRVRTNRLGTATAAVLVGCALGHVVRAAHDLGMASHAGPTPEIHVVDLLVSVGTAAVGVSYWSLQRTSGALVQDAVPSADPAEQARVAALEHRDAMAQVRAAADRERDAQAAMLRAVITNSHSLISVKDLQGRYLLVNTAFERTFGVTEAQVRGRTGEELDPDMVPLWRANDLRARDGEIAVQESARTSGGTRHFEAVKFPLRDSSGQVYATCAVSLDVTERLRSSAEITRARDSALAVTAATSAFLATMTHEVRTPLNAVIGLSELLLDTELDDRQRDLVETVGSSAEALQGVLDNVVDFSRIEAGGVELERVEFDLLACAERAVDVVAQGAARKGVEIVLEVGDRCPARVVGDVAQIRQVLVNLLHNAVKFTPAGHVLLSLDAGAAPASTAGATADGQVQVCFAVRDEGIGIPADRVDRLFRSFSQVDASTTRTYGGTGLGLAISKGLALGMGGDLSVDSTPGRGSTFTLSVPLGQVPGAGPVVTRDAALAGRSVLLVAADGMHRRVLERQLRSWGLVPTCVDDAEAAARLLSAPGPDGPDGAAGAAPADGGGGSTRFDVALLDGDVAHRRRADLEDVPPGSDARSSEAVAHAVTRLTGGGLPVVLLRSLAWAPAGSGAVAVVAKPVKRSVLLAALRSAVAGLALGPGQGAVHSAGEVAFPALPAGPAPSRQRLLLVEDNPINQKVARLMLDRLGYDVDIVGNGRQAVDAVTGPGAAYEVVLMDVNMPVMDGMEATRAIRAGLPPEQQPYVLALTASALVEDRRGCAAAGMDGYLTKPFREHELAAALDVATARQHRPGPRAPAGATPSPGG